MLPGSYFNELFSLIQKGVKLTAEDYERRFTISDSYRILTIGSQDSLKEFLVKSKYKVLNDRDWCGQTILSNVDGTVDLSIGAPRLEALVEELPTLGKLLEQRKGNGHREYSLRIELSPTELGTMLVLPTRDPIQLQRQKERRAQMLHSIAKEAYTLSNLLGSVKAPYCFVETAKTAKELPGIVFYEPN